MDFRNDELTECRIYKDLYRKKAESNRIMLLREKRISGCKINSQLREINLLKEELSKMSIALTQSEDMNSRLKKENED